MKETMRPGSSRVWRALGGAAAAVALMVAAGCGQSGIEGTALAGTDTVDQTASPSEATETSETSETTETTESSTTESSTTTQESEVSTSDTEEAPSSSSGSGDCPDTAGWDTTEESADLSGGAGIDGLSGDSTECFDSVTIRIKPSDVDPGYVVKYVDEVTQPGSGNPVQVAGGAALEVVVDSPTYDVSAGEEIFHMDDPENLLDVSSYFAIEQMAFGGSFEGMSTFAIGVSSELPFTVDTNTGDDDFRTVTISIAHAPSEGFGPEDEADNAGEYGRSADCDDATTWDSSAESSSELSIGGAIIGISSGDASCYEAITITIDPSDVLPGYDVKYVDVVTEDGSGAPVSVAGDAALQVVVGAPAYDLSTQEMTLDMDDQEHMLDVSGFSTIQQVAFAGSFEGMTRFAIGLSSELPFIVESSVGDDGNHHVTVKISDE